MAYGWGEHVGEVELWLEGADERAVLAEGVAALRELLGDDVEGGELEPRDVSAAAADRPGLLAAWLEELAYLAESEGFVPEAVETLELGPEHVRARVRGRRGTPPHLVKAVTYHRLTFAPAGDGWRATAVLDV